jgi:uncharacterized protein YaaQ
MKLIVAIVDDQDADKVMTALTNQRIGVTRVSSTGGLFSPGNSTLLIGVAEERVRPVMKIISDLGALRQAVVPYSNAGLISPIEVQVGGFISFVLDIDHFEQV